jgi:dimethylhistidine N-methyltransferase
MNTQCKVDGDSGLSAKQKRLSSMYFYDRKGDELFMQIMALPEYYLTRAELEVFTDQTAEMITALKVQKGVYFELIELGAGDGSKTKYLLQRLLEEGYDFDYMPVDISGNVLTLLETKLNKEVPGLSIKTQQGDYFTKLDDLKDSHHPKVVLFLGSNIGNMTDVKASLFVYDLGKSLSKGDKLLLGVDMIKPEYIVRPAYDDSQGITSAFNMNLLRRINNELGGNFNLNQFHHAPEYTEEEGIAKSYLQSKSAQRVTISSIGKTYEFDEGEKIHMEISRKYSTEIMQKIIKETDFQVINQLTDSKQYFSDYILERC